MQETKEEEKLEGKDRRKIERNTVCIRVFVHCREVNMFTSVGGDRMVLIWDHTAKKQLWQYPKYMLRVQDIVFNVDRSWLAVGVRDIPFIIFGGVCGCSGRQEQGVRGCGDGWQYGQWQVQRWAEVGRWGTSKFLRGHLVAQVGLDSG